jgi:hypothetical protein
MSIFNDFRPKSNGLPLCYGTYHNEVEYHYLRVLGYSKLSCEAASSHVKEIFGNDEIVVNSIVQ